MTMEHRLEEAGQGRKCDQARNHARAIDGKAFEPFGEKVSLGSEDEELVAKVCNCNIQRHGDDGREYHCKVQQSAWHDRIEQGENDGEADVTKQRIEGSHADVTQKLTTGKKTDEALKHLFGSKRVLRDGYDRRMFGMDYTIGDSPRHPHTLEAAPGVIFLDGYMVIWPRTPSE